MSASWRRTALVALLGTALPVAGLLASGCLWGIVTDTETGAPVVGANVICTDVNGNAWSTTTNALGIYAFDIDNGPIPAAGPAAFEISAGGYGPLTAARSLAYNDNPNASFSDLSSIWEVQSFSLSPVGARRNIAELQEVQITSRPAPAPGATGRYQVHFRVWSNDNLLEPACDLTSMWIDVQYPDPPPVSLAEQCYFTGEQLKVEVGVTLEMNWAPGIEEFVSSAETGWLLPGDDWAEALFDSHDAAAPDSPYLAFRGVVRYMSEVVLGPTALD